MSDYNKAKLDDAIRSLQGSREELKSFVSGDPELPRLVAIARTQMELAEAILAKAVDRLPG